MGDRVAILREGIIQQVGTPREVYERPANRFVAGFIGSPPMNFIPAAMEVDAGRAVVLLAGQRVKLPLSTPWAQNQEPCRCVLGVRPADILLRAPPEAEGRVLSVAVRVEAVEYLGSGELVHAHTTTGDFRISATSGAESGLEAGLETVVFIRLDDIRMFDEKTGRLLAAIEDPAAGPPSNGTN